MDVIGILTRAGIPYIERGSNVKRGNVNVHCPLCGDQDPSEHLGINTTTGVWGCWRNRAHRGRSLRSLLAHFVGISEARFLVGDQRPDPEEFDATLAALDDNPTAAITIAKPIRYPREAHRFRRGMRHRFGAYIFDRGFPDPLDFAETFNLRYCMSGPFNSRILFPVYNERSKMIAFTGRAIVPAELRYKAYPTGGVIKTSLFNYPAGFSANRLIICEGPFDAAKVSYYSFDAWAVALMGTYATEAQVRMLAHIAPQFREVCILLDHGAEQQALDLSSQLAFLKPTILSLPRGVKDPGDLTPAQVTAVVGG